MTTSAPLTLVLGSTGKTGSRVARSLLTRGLPVRTAARSGAQVHFDWDDPSTYRAALNGVVHAYVVPPVLRTDFAGTVADFLDVAGGSGLRHVTLLSARGVEHAEPGVALRAVELDLQSRDDLTWSIVRPAWFMQNFSETFLRPRGDEIVVPVGSGAEAFVDVDDIAAVAVETLAAPERHAGRAYAPTGPVALTLDQAAQDISAALGRRITYRDVDRDEWVAAMVQGGVPTEYGEVLRALTATIADGAGARPNGDVLEVTGSAPQDFAGFAARTVGAWA